jgi:hypothetical protein
MDLSELVQKHDQGEPLHSLAETGPQLIVAAEVDGL